MKRMISVWLGEKSGDKCIKKRSLHADKETERAEVCVSVLLLSRSGVINACREKSFV